MGYYKTVETSVPKPVVTMQRAAVPPRWEP